jgi:CheY-like chemotaxis protein
MTDRPQTILIVDDEFSIVETLGEILSWEGYAVVTAPNGRAALEEIQRQAPDLVILDFMMPVMDGLDMLRELRAQPRYAQLPVILMSAARVIGDAGEPRQYDALLRKPFEVSAVLALLRKLIPP